MEHIVLNNKLWIIKIDIYFEKQILTYSKAVK
jgi:hypothetical protein